MPHESHGRRTTDVAVRPINALLQAEVKVTGKQPELSLLWNGTNET
jgi:hypothetical protein